MHATLASTRTGKALISILIVVLVGALVAWNLPSSKLRAEALRVLGPVVRATGLDQNWSVFAPDPYRESFYLVARTTGADGTTRRWEVPEGGALVGTYWDYRWGKWAEWTSAGNADLCGGTARYVASREAEGGLRPVRVELLRRHRTNERPGATPAHGAWQETVVCTVELDADLEPETAPPADALGGTREPGA